MKTLVKELRKLGFKRVSAIPIGFVDDVRKIRDELRGKITAWELVKGDKEFPKIDERYEVRCLGYWHGWFFYFVGKRRNEKLGSPFSPSPSFLKEGGEKQRNSKVPFSPEERAKWGKRWDMEERE